MSSDVCSSALIDLEYVLQWNQGLDPATEEVGEVLQAQSLNIQQIDETIGREQRYARTHTFDHRVGADCRSMHQSHRLAGINEACLDDALDTLDEGIRVVRRSLQYLEAFDRRIALPDALPYLEIRELTSNINALNNLVTLFLQHVRFVLY